MMFTLTQIVLIVFLIFALSRVILRFQGGIISLIGMLFWSAVFVSAIIFVIFPFLTNRIAALAGVGRGADVVIYVSIALLFYLVFRIYIYLEDIKHDITELVKKMAIQEEEKKSKK